MIKANLGLIFIHFIEFAMAGGKNNRCDLVSSVEGSVICLKAAFLLDMIGFIRKGKRKALILL